MKSVGTGGGETRTDRPVRRHEETNSKLGNHKIHGLVMVKSGSKEIKEKWEPRKVARPRARRELLKEKPHAESGETGSA